MDTHSFSLFYRPYRIPAPGHVQPCFTFSHHFLAKISFPTCYQGFHGFQILLNCIDGCLRIVVHQLLYRNLAFFQILGIGINQCGTICITITFLHQDLVLIFQIPKTGPSPGIFRWNMIGIKKDTCCSPHITDGII